MVNKTLHLRPREHQSRTQGDEHASHQFALYFKREISQYPPCACGDLLKYRNGLMLPMESKCSSYIRISMDITFNELPSDIIKSHQFTIQTPIVRHFTFIPIEL